MKIWSKDPNHPTVDTKEKTNTLHTDEISFIEIKDDSEVDTKDDTSIQAQEAKNVEFDPEKKETLKNF